MLIFNVPMNDLIIQRPFQVCWHSKDLVREQVKTDVLIWMSWIGIILTPHSDNHR